MRDWRLRTSCFGLRTSLDFLARHAAVRLEHARRGKLAEFVADHVLGDVDGDERLAIVHAERVADEVGRDGRAAGPGLNRLLGAGLRRLLDFLEQVIIDEETFFDGTCHGAKSAAYFLLRGLRPLWWVMIWLVESLVRLRVT